MRFSIFGKNFAFAAIALFLAGCGGNTQITFKEEAKNSSIYLQMNLKPELESMEAELFKTYFSQMDCSSDSSPFAETVGELVSVFNEKLGDIIRIDKSIERAVLLNIPPRDDGEIAVYLCDNLQSKAYTLYRSILISNSFLEELKATASGWSRDDLFKPAAAFVLYHELGHAALNHSAIGLGIEEGVSFDLPQEIDADQFSYDLLSSAGFDLDGKMLADAVGD